MAGRIYRSQHLRYRSQHLPGAVARRRHASGHLQLVMLVLLIVVPKASATTRRFSLAVATRWYRPRRAGHRTRRGSRRAIVPVEVDLSGWDGHRPGVGGRDVHKAWMCPHSDASISTRRWFHVPRGGRSPEASASPHRTPPLCYGVVVRRSTVPGCVRASWRSRLGGERLPDRREEVRHGQDGSRHHGRGHA
jgi:hypothetical protein